MADGVKTATAEDAPRAPGLDLDEKGRPKNGEPQKMDRRLFVQLLVFNGCRDARPVREVWTHAQD